MRFYDRVSSFDVDIVTPSTLLARLEFQSSTFGALSALYFLFLLMIKAAHVVVLFSFRPQLVINNGKPSSFPVQLWPRRTNAVPILNRFSINKNIQF